MTARKLRRAARMWNASVVGGVIVCLVVLIGLSSPSSGGLEYLDAFFIASALAGLLVCALKSGKAAERWRACQTQWLESLGTQELLNLLGGQILPRGAHQFRFVADLLHYLEGTRRPITRVFPVAVLSHVVVGKWQDEPAHKRRRAEALAQLLGGRVFVPTNNLSSDWRWGDDVVERIKRRIPPDFHYQPPAAETQSSGNIHRDGAMRSLVGTTGAP